MFFGLMAAVAGSAAGGTLARPSVPAFSAAPGANDGEVVLTVTGLPTSWGDLVAPGDGLGAAGILQWWSEDIGWQTLADPAALGAHTLALSQSLWGTSAMVMVRGISAAGAAGSPASAVVAVPLAQPFTIMRAGGGISFNRYADVQRTGSDISWS